jgi:hypothetical protein
LSADALEGEKELVDKRYLFNYPGCCNCSRTYRESFGSINKPDNKYIFYGRSATEEVIPAHGHLVLAY